MTPILIAGTIIVNLALVAYSVAIISEQLQKRVTNRVLAFLSVGVFFDVIATICMVMGSTQSFLSAHGFLGYSALLVMLVDCALLWRFRTRYGAGQIVDKGLHLYSRIAFSWWIIAYITGAILVALRHM